jgi:hypothetical protein
MHAAILPGEQVSIAQDLDDKHYPIPESCRTLKISKVTLYRSINTNHTTIASPSA